MVPLEPIATLRPVAPLVTPSPCAMPKAPLTTAPRPTAMPEVAAATTEDCPPMAMPSVAAEVATPFALLPMAIEPLFEAREPLPAASEF